MQQQQFEEEATRQGYSPEEYREVVRRAQQIRADRDKQLSHDVLVESAAEVGIREEDLREAARQLREERALQQAQRQQRNAQIKIAGAVLAIFLALTLLFGYNSLNTRQAQVEETRANLHSTLQRKADLIPQLTAVVQQNDQQSQALAQQLARAEAGLRSTDVSTQLAANEEAKDLVGKIGLGAGEVRRDLIAEISGSENRINVARQRYNAAATAYNRTAQSFPINLVRPILGKPGSVPLFQGNVGTNAL